jgi:hypothetical protein
VSTTDDDSHRATESNQAPAQPDVPRCGPGGRVAHPQGQFGPDLDSLRPPGVGRESQGRRRIDGIDGRDSARHRHRIRRGRRRGLRSPGRRPLMGAVACATLEVSLGGRVDFSASARPRLARPLGARTGELASLPLRLVVHVIGCRGEPATMGRAVTHQAPVTTRRPPLPSSASSGHDDTARHDPQAHGLRARTSPAQRRPLRCRGGAGRWAIRWATPRRIGPYQAQCRALSGTADWADLQVFRCLEAPRTPCFTRERSQVRNPPRPSSKPAIHA